MFDWSIFLTTILNSFPIGLFGAWLGKVWAASILGSQQHELEKKLRSEQHELEKKLSVYKYELEISRVMLQNSSLKRHEIYPNMFSLIQKSYGLISALNGIQMLLDWNNFGRSDFLHFIKDINATDLIKNEFLSRLDNSTKKEAIDYLEEYLKDKKFSDSRTTLIESKNYAIQNALFLSLDVADQLMEIHHTLECALADFESVRDGYVEFGEEGRQNKRKAKDKIEILKQSMRNELNPGQHSYPNV